MLVYRKPKASLSVPQGRHKRFGGILFPLFAYP